MPSKRSVLDRSGGVALGGVVLAIGLLTVAAASNSAVAPPLRVCADPNNLPFSNHAGEGFENHLATLVGRDLNERVEYTWWAQRRGFFRNTLNAGICDVVLGVPTSIDMLRRTRPYYRSEYVFVTRRDRALHIQSLDDPTLRHLRIGVPMVGDDYAATPPAEALIRRGLAKNLVSYSVFGEYEKPNPPARLINAVRQDSVDVAIAWGPLAGYFARGSDSALVITPVSPQIDLPFLPMAFDIAVGVRRADTLLAIRLDSVLVRKRAAIDSLLAAYNVPRLDATTMSVAWRSR